jgi:hypothetical protein
MTSERALIRLIRVAEILAKDSTIPDTVARAHEIIALARIVAKGIPNDES